MEQIECPWCGSEVIIVNDICPMCKHEVLLDSSGNVRFLDSSELISEELDETSSLNLEDVRALLLTKFVCGKCEGRNAEIRDLAMTGTGLSKILNLQYNHFMFISCDDCGFTEVYDPNALSGKSFGRASTMLDLFFGK